MAMTKSDYEKNVLPISIYRVLSEEFRDWKAQDAWLDPHPLVFEQFLRTNIGR